MQATYCEKVLIVKFLLEHGAEVNLRDKDGLTALHYVMLENNRNKTELTRILIVWIYIFVLLIK